MLSNDTKKFAIRSAYAELWSNSWSRPLDGKERNMANELMAWMIAHDREYWDSGHPRSRVLGDGHQEAG